MGNAGLKSSTVPAPIPKFNGQHLGPQSLELPERKHRKEVADRTKVDFPMTGLFADQATRVFSVGRIVALGHHLQRFVSKPWPCSYAFCLDPKASLCVDLFVSV